MKRYQCIKDFRMDEKAHQMPGELAFKVGTIYEGEQLNIEGAVEFKSEISTSHSLSPTSVRVHFHELMDLHVDDHEEDQYMAFIPSTKALGTGCAIVVAALLTIVITLISMI